VGFLTQQLVLAPIFAAIAFAVAGALPADRGAEAHVPTKGLRLPQGILLAVCLMPMGALMVEGAMMEWSALFLRGDVGLGAFQAAAVFAVFEVAMAAARLSGDRLIERFGARAVLATSAVVAALGVLVFALSPGLVVAMAGATLTGLGIANIYPLAMSRAAEIPGPNPENNIATVAFAAFTIYLVSPPLIGTLGSALGLTMAFVLLTPVALYPLFMLRAALTGRMPAAS
jgi:fucose permease